jgi:hypothetical protein
VVCVTPLKRIVGSIARVADLCGNPSGFKSSGFAVNEWIESRIDVTESYGTRKTRLLQGVKPIIVSYALPDSSVRCRQSEQLSWQLRL